MRLLIIFSSLISLNAYSSSTIKFVAKTNGPGITVEGEVKDPKVKLDMNRLESTAVGLDVMDLFTGMEKRDKHLHEKVFAASKLGDAKIDFAVTKIICPAANKDEVECDTTGNLTIKGVSNEVKMKAIVNKKSKTVAGTTLVSLNQFHLNAPSFMGISVEDAVEVSFKVSAE